MCSLKSSYNAHVHTHISTFNGLYAYSRKTLVEHFYVAKDDFFIFMSNLEFQTGIKQTTQPHCQAGSVVKEMDCQASEKPRLWGGGIGTDASLSMNVNKLHTAFHQFAEIHNFMHAA